jgi:cutinase
LPSGAGIPGFKTGRDVEKRQFDLSSLTSGLGGGTGTSGGLGSLESLIPSLGGSSGSGGLGSLGSLIPSLGGSSGTSGGLGALESLIPSLGSSGSSGLGFKARRDAKEAEKRNIDLNVGANAGAGLGAGSSIEARDDNEDVEKRQFDLSSLTSGLGGSSGTNSGLGALESLIPSIGGSSGSSGLSIPGLSNIPSGSGISSLKAKRQSLLGSGSTTSNDVTDNSGCKELTFIFARGSDEMGNMGSVVGPPVATQLKSLTGDKVSVQGVTYAATAGV